MRKLLPLIFLVVTPVAQAQFMIGQIRTSGSAGLADEFVLACNNSGGSQNISGYKLRRSTSTGSTLAQATAGSGTFGGNTTLANGECYLFAGPSFDDFTFASAPYPFSASGATIIGYTQYSTGMADNGGAALTTSADVVIDQVGFSTGSAYKEGTPLTPKSLANDDRYVRFQDTNNNVGDFSTATGSLPVELASFSASADGTSALLRWTTESETNNAGFTVEQQHGATWLPVGMVAGRGTTSERATYSYTVANLAAGIYRFRLRQTDFDGATSYSPIVEVTVLDEAPLRLWMQGRTPVFTTRAAQSVRVEAFDVLGRRAALLFEGFVDAGTLRTLDPLPLAGGLYVLRVTGAGATLSLTIVLR